MKTFVTFISLCYLSCAASAFKITYKADTSYQACGQVHSSLTSTLPSRSFNASVYCDPENGPAFGSIAYCLRTSFNDDAISSFLRTCKRSGFDISKQQFHQLYGNASAYIVNSQDLGSNASEVAQVLPVRFSTVQVRSISDQLFKTGLNQNYLIFFSTALALYWFAVCILAGLVHWSRFLFPKLAAQVYLSGPVNWLRKYLVLPPLFRKHHFSHKRFGFLECLIPLRFEALLIFGYVVLAVVFCASNIETTNSFTARALGDRSGILATFTIPVLILFGGRNNFLQIVTGWQFSRFILLHKWIARVAFCLLVTHAVAKTLTLKYYNAYPLSLSQNYMIWGIVATVAISLLLVISLSWFRKNRYELFLLIHYILAILFIAGGWIHVKENGQAPFFISAVAIWGLNIFIRLTRISAFGIQTATIELKAHETIKVTIKRPSWYVPHAGSHGFVHFLTPTGFWQSHPFTMVDSPIEANTIGLYAKIKGGMTHGLYQKLVEQPNHTMEIKVSLEGPYFERMPLHSMDRLVFIASGNGIPGMYGGAREMADSSSYPVKLVWTIRDYSSLTWFYGELKALQGRNVDVHIYVTRGSGVEDLTHRIEVFLEKNNASIREYPKRSGSICLVTDLKDELPFVTFHEGRPDMGDLVSEEVLLAGLMSIGFVTCGIPSMVDDVRVKVVDQLKRNTKAKIELFEQLQVW